MCRCVTVTDGTWKLAGVVWARDVSSASHQLTNGRGNRFSGFTWPGIMWQKDPGLGRTLEHVNIKMSISLLLFFNR